MTDTYTNPVFDRYMADPFVLLHDGVYYAYGTAEPCADGRVFPVLRSTDLVNWEAKGGALTPLRAGSYWAPAVAYADGLFYLYYSVGEPDGTGHKLRVATSPSPIGPFTDAGVELVPDQPFTIDAHPFQDADGQWYLYYCQDFLDMTSEVRVGTGIAVDRMVSMTQLSGESRVVVRPFADWQLFAAQRPMYGGVYDWHTIEGAAVLRHNDRIYCFYSGGAWEQSNYGISYVVADAPMDAYRRPASAEPLVKTVPGRVVGPGHNSFVTAPDGTTALVYHAWDVERTARRMCIDRMTWSGDQPQTHAPTFTPQPIFSQTEQER